MARNKLDLDQFMAYMAKKTKEAGYQVEGYFDSVLFITLHHQPQGFQLGSLYDGYKADPRRLGGILDSHFQLLRLYPPSRLLPTDRDLEESILPMIQTEEWLAEQSRQTEWHPISRPLIDNLIVVYAIDAPYLRMYLNHHVFGEMNRLFGMSEEDIHQLSLKNLRRRTSRYTTEKTGKGLTTLLGCNTGDGYSAARILLPKFMRRWERTIKGRMLVCIPSRDVLVAFSENAPLLELILLKLHADYESYQYKVSTKLYLWEDGQLKDYEQ